MIEATLILNDQKQFTKRQVNNIVWEVLDYYWIQDTAKFWMDFEERLNDQGLNWNNGENEHLLEKYQEYLTNMFIYN